MGFKTIRIRESDHERLTKHVTYELKIYDIIGLALDALEAKQKK